MPAKSSHKITNSPQGVNALQQGIQKKKRMTVGGWSMAKNCYAGQQEELLLHGRLKKKSCYDGQQEEVFLHGRLEKKSLTPSVTLLHPGMYE
jgi:hypothetical protein